MQTAYRTLFGNMFAFVMLAGIVIGNLPALAGSSRPTTQRSEESPTQVYLPLIDTSGATRFAVIGDYGTGSQAEADVAALVKRWQPDFIITTGDNNYPNGEAATIDPNIGAYYHEFIAPYQGQYGPGSSMNRFFPSLGNHDWVSGAGPYLDYFTLPGNERYYDQVWNQVHLFALDSDPHEPDGVESTSIQAMWLQQALADSKACWKLVFMHHPPFSSGRHGSNPWMQWPYQAWGADAVLSGHDHTYERIERDGMVYFVNGLGGNIAYPFGTPVPGSAVRYNGDVGAMLVEADHQQIEFSFVTRANTVVDTYRVSKTCR